MTRNDDFIRQLEGYLDEYEGSTPLPNEVSDAVRAQLPSIQQRPAWWPARRLPEMNNVMKLSLAAAAVVVAAFLGFNYLVAPNLGGGPEGTPTPSPTPSPTSYLITNEEGVRVTLALPRGWVRGGWLVNNARDTRTELTAIQVWAVTGNSYTDPCQWTETELDPPLGPTVDDLATALENQLTRAATTSDVTLDGYTGTLVQMTVPADQRFVDCDSGEFRSWDGRFHQGPGQQDDVYILDVEGFRLVIDALSYPGSPAEDLEKLQQMLDTIQIEPPA